MTIKDDIFKRFEDEQLAAYYYSRHEFIRWLRKRPYGGTVDMFLEARPDIPPLFRHKNQHGPLANHAAFRVVDTVTSHRNKARHNGLCRRWEVHPMCDMLTPVQCLEATRADVRSWNFGQMGRPK